MQPAALFRYLIIDNYFKTSWRQRERLICLINFVDRLHFRIVSMPIRAGERRVGRNLNEEVGVIILSGTNCRMVGVNFPHPVPMRIETGISNADPLLRTVVKLGNDFKFLPGRDIEECICFGGQGSFWASRLSDTCIKTQIER